MDLKNSDKKKEKKEPSFPGLRPRKNAAPSTSTPVPAASRKRKSSLSSESGNSAKKPAEIQTKKMIRSPAATKKSEKSTFRLDPPTLLVGNVSSDAHGGLPIPTPDNISMGADGDVDLDLEGSVSDLLGDTATSTSAAQENILDTNTQNDKDEDPFVKLQKMMTLNFASMKSDNLTLSGQLGLLQNNVVGRNE